MAKGKKMAKTLGPNFGTELAAAGLTCVAGYREGGTEEDILFTRTATDEDRAAVAAVVAAHNPATIPVEQRSKVATLVLDLLDALVAEGILPAVKAAAIKSRLKL